MISVVDVNDSQRRAMQQVARDGEGRDEGLAGLTLRLRDRVASAGAALVRGVPVRSDAVLMALARGLGEPDAESNGGQIIHEVSPRSDDRAGDLSTSSATFPPHTDSTFLVEPHDVVCLACAHAAPSGGRSTVVRAQAVRNRLLARSAAHVERLEEPVYPFPLKDPRASRQGVQLCPSSSRERTESTCAGEQMPYDWGRGWMRRGCARPITRPCARSPRRWRTSPRRARGISLPETCSSWTTDVRCTGGR